MDMEMAFVVTITGDFVGSRAVTASIWWKPRGIAWANG
jgi:hypothetical protein